jgi:HlyD family secretion protein
MKKWKKIAIGAGAVVVLGLVVLFSVLQAQKGVVTVQSGKVTPKDLTSLVTASGEIRPKTYTNVLGEGFGKITEIIVKEGDYVKKGDVLLKLESIQPSADVDAQQAAINSAEAGIRSAEANFRSGQATLAQRQADLEKAKFDWGRGQDLFKAQLIAKQEYDARKSAYDSAIAAVDASQAQLQQTRAVLEQTRSILAQNHAVLVHSRDVLRKTTYQAPISGLVTYIAVRVGENVVPGIQNAEGSYLMTISDMSIVTAEVKVDETDITNVRSGQAADVTIDALPGKTYKGHVSVVGDQAVLRSSGLATTQTTANTQEARDFKVIVTIDNPPQGLRPGLSSTAKIQTAQKKNVLAIPIQALAVRTERELKEAEKLASKKKDGGAVTLAAQKTDTASVTGKDEIQGVFVIRGKKAMFVPVETGITGVTDIEVTSGLKEGDEIVIGSYKALRTLKPGASVKVDNTAPKLEESQS